MGKLKKDNFGRVPQNFKGTRDFDGLEAKKRTFVIDQIRNVFELFGFEPLETPAIELGRILDGKYGEEGQKNLFKLSTSNDESQAGLRYDHTVPLARFMAMNPTSKVLPYRRYAIGKIWRNESVQAGRYREFTQCDFDTVGSSSLIVDAEILAINFTILTSLGFPSDVFEMQYNDRRLLNVMTSYLGCSDNQRVEILRAWDKILKVGLEATAEELKQKGLPKQVILNYVSFTQEILATDEQFAYLEKVLGTSGSEALSYIRDIYVYAKSMGVPEENIFSNPLLARGLEYYTGPIFEIVIEQSGIGSISGGGRFDNLIETLGGPSLPASGSSFGLDRVISVMDQLGIKIPVETASPVFVTIFDPKNINLVKRSFQIATKLRLDGIPVEIYTGNQPKLGKQFEIASRKGCQVVVIIGESELQNNTVTLKQLSTGNQQTISQDQLLPVINQLLS